MKVQTNRNKILFLLMCFLPLLASGEESVNDPEMKAYEHKKKDVENSKVEAIESIRGKSNRIKQSGNPLDGELYRFLSNVARDPVFLTLVAADLGKDAYLVRSVWKKTQKLKAEIEKQSAVVSRLEKNHEKTRMWIKELNRLKSEILPLAEKVEKTASELQRKAGSSETKGILSKLGNDYSQLRRSLSQILSDLKTTELRGNVKPLESLKTLLSESGFEKFRNNGQILSQQVLSRIVELNEDIKLQEPWSEKTEKARFKVKTLNAAILESLKNDLGSKKWRATKGTGIGLLVLGPKIGYVLYLQRLEDIYEAELSRIQINIEEELKSQSESTTHLEIEMNILSLRKTVITVWNTFFDPSSPDVINMAEIDGTFDLACPISDTPVGGDQSHLLKLYELDQEIRSEIREERNGNNKEKALIWSDENIRIYSQRYFRKLFRKLIDDSPNLNEFLKLKYGDKPRALDDLIQEMSNVAFTEFAEIKLAQIEMPYEGVVIPITTDDEETPFEEKSLEGESLEEDLDQ